MGNLTKSTRNPSDFLDSDEKPDYYEKLEYFDANNNNNKFWYIWVYGRFVIRHWGRHGAKGQRSVHTAYSIWDARNEADKLYWKKTDKGYVKDQTTILDHIARRL